MKREEEMNGRCGSDAKRYFGWPFWATIAALAGLGAWWTLTPMPAGDYGVLSGETVTVRAEKPSKTAVERKRRENARVLESEKLKQEEQDYRNDIRRRTALFQSNIDAAYERFIKQIPFADAQVAIEAAHTGARFLASKEGLCGYKALSGMACKLAYDKIKEANTFDAFVNPLFECHVMRHVQDAVEVYKTKLASFQQEVECEMMAYQADVLLRGQQFNDALSEMKVLDPKAVKVAQDRIAAFDSQVKGMTGKAVFTTLGAVAETVFIKSTIASVKAVGKKVIVPLLAKTVTRLVASYTAAGTLIVADGPFPVGDILGGAIAVGGTAWTAYEIYQVMDVIPKEVEENLCGCINGIDSALKETTVTQAKTIVTEMKKWSNDQTKGL